MFRFLGTLVSALALTSLVYHAFEGSLAEYMNGVVGGAVEVYRSIRDLVVTGVGLALSGLVNGLRPLLTWLPPAPWFNFPEYLSDSIFVYMLLGTAYFKTYPNDVGVLDQQFWYKVNVAAKWPWRIASAVKLLWLTPRPWPKYTWEDYTPEKYEFLNAFNNVTEWFSNAAIVSIGTLLFLILAYAETRLGF